MGIFSSPACTKGKFTNNTFFVLARRQETSGTDCKPSLGVSTEKQGGGVVVRIQDNGTGMSKATSANIFQPFFATKPTGEGTGLVLSLSYDIVTKGHGGRIEVESAEGKGTTFTVVLPIA